MILSMGAKDGKEDGYGYSRESGNHCMNYIIILPLIDLEQQQKRKLQDIYQTRGYLSDQGCSLALQDAP